MLMIIDDRHQSFFTTNILCSLPRLDGLKRFVDIELSIKHLIGMITLTCVTFQTSVKTYDGSLFLLHHLVVFLFVFIHCHCGVIVKPLSHKLQCQRVLLSGGLFNLCSFILEPNFDLILMKL